MKYGVCVGDDYNKIPIAAEAGYDFVESCFSLLAEKDDEHFYKFAEALKVNSIPCLSVNCFLPGRLKVTGPDVDYTAVSEYVERGMKRGMELGIRKVVFGSSGARNVPDGFSYAEAYRQLVYFLKEVASPIAEKYGITVIIEPLSRNDSNIVNSAYEGIAIISQVNKSNVNGLVDLYHMCNVGDTPDNVRRLKGCITHSHIATPFTRAYPKPEDDFDYRDFIAALEEAGCDSCALEGSTQEFEKDSKISAELFKNIG